MPSATQRLLELGQSVWLDFLGRDLLNSGRLQRMVEAGDVTGITSNPTIFEKAISSSDTYDDDLAALARAGESDPYLAFVTLAVDDVRRACDILRPAYENANGGDGFVSLEIPPGIESNTFQVVEEAQRLARLVDRPNVMIKVPGTPQGVEALALLIEVGVNVNQTLLFDVGVYEKTAAAYIRGLERRRAAGNPVSRPASVASFFVSRLDTAVDNALPADSPLRGKAAVANARHAYRRFQDIFSGPRWESLAAQGARPQRPLWASTGTKNPAYSDILYVETLIAPHTVNTVPEATLQAVLDHLDARHTLVPGIPEAEATLAALPAAGIDLQAVTSQLLVEGLAAFERDFLKLLERLKGALAASPAGRV